MHLTYLPHPRSMWVIWHFIQLIDDKYDAGQQLTVWWSLENVVRMSLKFKIYGAKMPVWVFVSYLHHIVKQYHMSNKCNITRVYDSDLIQQLIVCYFRHNVVCFAQFCQRKYKAKAELLVSEQHTAAFHFLIHVLNDSVEPLKGSSHTHFPQVDMIL